MKLEQQSRLLPIILFAFAFLLYANTLRHGFVLDDDVVIVRNQFVHQGLDGIWAIFSNDSFAGFERIGTGESILEGGRYRPLSLVCFALLHSVFGLSPEAFHFFSIFLYAISALVMYQLSVGMLKGLSFGRWAPFIITALFIAHPVHTEVVANCKSADEMLALLFGMTAMLFVFKAHDSRNLIYAGCAGLAMLLACFSKENAISFVVAAPLALWYFRKTSLSAVMQHTWPLLASSMLFVICRAVALDEGAAGSMMNDPLNNPFLQWDGQAWVPCSLGVKMATILYTFGRYCLLVIIPYPLTHDYLPFHIQLQNFANPIVIVSGFILIGMFVLGIRSLMKRWLSGYGVLFFLVPFMFVSNVFFPIGTFMAERFLYIPSFGLILTITIAGNMRLSREKQHYFSLGAAVVIVIFSALTLARSPAWKDNETLFRTDVKVSVNSIKMQYDQGVALLEKAIKESDPAMQKQFLEEAFPHLEKAVELHPTYYDALLAYGACAYYVQRYDLSVEGYRNAAKLSQGDVKATTGLRYALKAYGTQQWTIGDSVLSISNLTAAWTMQPDSVTAIQLATYYQQMGKFDESKEWLDKAKTANH